MAGLAWARSKTRPRLHSSVWAKYRQDQRQLTTQHFHQKVEQKIEIKCLSLELRRQGEGGGMKVIHCLVLQAVLHPYSPTVLQSCTDWFLCQLQSQLMQSSLANLQLGGCFSLELLNICHLCSSFIEYSVSLLLYMCLCISIMHACICIMHCVKHILYKTLAMNGMNDCSSSDCPLPSLSDSSSLTIRPYTQPLFLPVETQLINNSRGGYRSLLLTFNLIRDWVKYVSVTVTPSLCL